MNPHTRLFHALSCQTVDRIPFMPKIWVDWSASFLGISYIDMLSDPFTALKCLPEAASTLELDGSRMFHFPKRTIRMEGDYVYELDSQNRILGTIDMQGGFTTILEDTFTLSLDDPYISAHEHMWKTSSPKVSSMTDVSKIAVPTKRDLSEMGWEKGEQKVIEEFGNKTALVGDCHTATMSYLVSLRGVEQAIFDLFDNPSLVHAVMDKGESISIEKGKFHCDQGLDILRLNDSTGNMSMLSPDLWRSFIFPHMKTVCEELHRYKPGVKIYCHICGNVEPILEDLVDTGLDCIGPLDPLGGMDVRRARERVGSDIALMGGINTLSFINSSQEEILKEAQQCIAGGGETGYILGSGCALPRESKTELITALRDFVKTYQFR